MVRSCYHRSAASSTSFFRGLFRRQSLWQLMQLMVRQGMVPMMNPAKQIRLVMTAVRNRKPNSNSSLKEALVAETKHVFLILFLHAEF